MDAELSNLKIVLILTFGFALASIAGYITQRLKLSPILGYLIAGYAIGPYSPGFVAEHEVSEQLAEIGVILMMFGVGLHFKWNDLVKVRNIAIPGAVGQTFMAALCSTIFIYIMGWPIEYGLIIGLAIGVASTVVLVRVLSDNLLLDTVQGHIAVGWLVVEDIFTVAVLLSLPSIAEAFHGTDFSIWQIASSIIVVLIKFLVLVIIMFTFGHKMVSYLLFKIARTRSHELFTLTVLSLTFVVATGSALIFGTSIALGAFIAGMVIGQTHVRHQASANALPLKDTFVVIFFLSVGMLFNPQAIMHQPLIFLGILIIILIIKPLTALVIVLAWKYPLRVAVTVAMALAQIGEFSFILSEEAMKFKLLPEDGYDMIVACALISISLNPLLFKWSENFTHYLESKTIISSTHRQSYKGIPIKKALVVGFGPIGQSVAKDLELMGVVPVVIDRNVDTIARLIEDRYQAIYGDASHTNILEGAHIEDANLLIITIPDISATISIVSIARQLNENIPIIARIRYASDRKLFDKLDIQIICCEEESMEAFHEALFRTEWASL